MRLEVDPTLHSAVYVYFNRLEGFGARISELGDARNCNTVSDRSIKHCDQVSSFCLCFFARVRLPSLSATAHSILLARSLIG